MSRVFCTFFPQKVLIAVCDWCSLPLFGRQKAANKPSPPLALLVRIFLNAFFAKRESFAAERGGKDAFGTSRKHRSLRSPLEAVLNRRIIVRSGKKEHSPARVPGAGGCKGLILLRPLNAGRRRLPRRTTCGWFWCYLLPSKGSYTPRAKTAALLLFAAKKYKMPRSRRPRLTADRKAA